jgi:MFS family permease
MRSVVPLVGVLAATAMSVTANSIVAIAVPWLVLERTGSAALAGLAGAAAIAPIVFSAVFGGALIDRIGKRRTSMIADTLSASAVAALPLADATVGLTVGLVLVLVAVGAVFDSPARPPGRRCVRTSPAGPGFRWPG